MSPRTPASSARHRRGRPAPIEGHSVAPERAARAWRPGFLVAASVALVSLAALLWACRGGELGTPAADDYDYLHALRFEQPLDLLGPMQSLWYWRPLGRQAYYALFDPLFFTAPGLVAAAHAALLLVLYVLAYRTARRWLSPLASAALAAFPILAEPTRALLAWPTAAQPLLAMVFIALALHEAAARRIVIAGAALMAALLCHEQALLAAPAVPILLALDGRKDLRRGLLVAVAVVAIYGALRVAAIGHGAGVPERIAPALALAGAPDILGRSAAAQLVAFPMPEGAGAFVPWAEAALVATALVVWATHREGRHRLRRAAPVLALGGAWFVFGVLPMAFAPDLWTPRHSCLPGLGLGLLATVLLASARPALAAGFAGVRLVALLLAPTVPSIVPLDPLREATPFSFLHVTRLQRTADSARQALVTEHETLPRSTASAAAARSPAWKASIARSAK